MIPIGMDPLQCLAFALSQPEWQLTLGLAGLVGAVSYAFYRVSSSAEERLRGLYGLSLGASLGVGFLLSTVACVLFLTACNTNFMTAAVLALPLTGLLTLGVAYVYGDRLAALAYGAKPLNNPFLTALVRRLSASSGVPLPHLYYFDSGEVRVVSTAGRSNAIFLSMGALESLSQQELQVVMTHELAHVRHRDPLKKLAIRLTLAPSFLLQRVIQEHEQRADLASGNTAVLTRAAAKFA